jgi:hypothetical protein
VIYNQNNVVAVHHAARMVQQSHQVAQQNMLRQQMRNQQLLLLLQKLPAAPEEGQAVEHDVTSLGLEVSQSYTIKEALLTGGVYQVELLDADGNVLCTGMGDRDDAVLEIAIRLVEGEKPDDLPDYT